MNEATCLVDGCVKPVDLLNIRELCSECHEIYFGEFYRTCPPSQLHSEHLKKAEYSKAERPCMHPFCVRTVDYKGGRGFCATCFKRWNKWLKRKNLLKPPKRQNIDARYPSDHELVDLMKKYGSLNKVAIIIGVSAESFHDYYTRRDGLRKELEKYRAPVREHRWGNKANLKRPSGNPWTRQRRSDGTDRRQVFPITPEARLYVRVLRRHPCIYCGAPSYGVDHVRALTRGGGWELDNLVPVCMWCNNKKSTKPLLVFLCDTRDERMARRCQVAQAEADGLDFGHMAPIPEQRDSVENTTKTVIASSMFTSGQQLCLALLFSDGSALDVSGDANAAGSRPRPRGGRRTRSSDPSSR